MPCHDLPFAAAGIVRRRAQPIIASSRRIAAPGRHSPARIRAADPVARDWRARVSRRRRPSAVTRRAPRPRLRSCVLERVSARRQRGRRKALAYVRRHEDRRRTPNGATHPAQTGRRDSRRICGRDDRHSHLRYRPHCGAKPMTRSAAARMPGWASSMWRDFLPPAARARAAHRERTVRRSGAGVRYRDDERAWQAWRAAPPVIRSSTRRWSELKTTGWMHNRLRMVVASFLSKHCCSTTAAASAISNSIWPMPIWPRTTAAGSGRPRPAPTPAPYFADLQSDAARPDLDPEGTFVRRSCPRWQTCPSVTCTRRGRCRRCRRRGRLRDRPRLSGTGRRSRRSPGARVGGLFRAQDRSIWPKTSRRNTLRLV